MSQPKLAKRFYETVSIEQLDSRYAIALDGRLAKTRGGAVLSSPTSALSDAIAQEWSGQADDIDRSTMPLTALQSAALDASDETTDFWAREVISYLGSDLICYRAEKPAELAECQEKAWAPFLKWIAENLNVHLRTTTGVVAIAQDAVELDRLRDDLKKQSREVLHALYIATGVTGSAVLAFAAWRQAFEPAEIFAASRVDEDFQQKQWGVDSEAKERAELLRGEFVAVYRFFSLLSA